MNYECYLRLKWKIEQIPEVMEFDIDDTTHNINRDALAAKFEKLGYRVKHEPWLSYEFDEFILSHRIDLYIENDVGTKAFVEVKSAAKKIYNNQFRGSMLLIALNKQNAEYWVYGYKTNELKPMLLSDPDIFRDVLEKKILKIIFDRMNPYSDLHCYSCGYLQCDNNPRHNDCHDVLSLQTIHHNNNELQEL